MAAWGVDLYLLPESLSKDMLHMRCAYERDSNGDALHVLFALLFPKGGASRMLPRGDLQAHAASLILRTEYNYRGMPHFKKQGRCEVISVSCM